MYFIIKDTPVRNYVVGHQETEEAAAIKAAGLNSTNPHKDIVWYSVWSKDALLKALTGGDWVRFEMTECNTADMHHEDAWAVQTEWLADTFPSDRGTGEGESFDTFMMRTGAAAEITESDTEWMAEQGYEGLDDEQITHLMRYGAF